MFSCKGPLVSIEDWSLRKFNIHCSFDKQGILCGKYENNNIYRLQNILILVAKQFIFATKYKNVPKLHVDALIKVINDRIFVEKFTCILLQNCRYVMHCNNHIDISYKSSIIFNN
jgi:hypothetical protein